MLFRKENCSSIAVKRQGFVADKMVLLGFSFKALFK